MRMCECTRMSKPCKNCGGTTFADFDSLTFLQELRQANLRRVPDFGPGNGLHDWSLAERGNELCGESGELANVLKKLRRTGRHTPMKPELVLAAIEELADGYVCLDLIAAQLGYTTAEVERAIRDKFNQTSDKIGSKVKL